ncbi:MAG: carboxypeptidase regulatory-like domain-containing protein, partial [Candidatus Aminicenantes bacterium]|nr:carboxypeptidase regulatory-like domain-containing protein [Candidatus Aminicenantes bacterium]MDH5384972.1 carboxypeptidase regulatory-like domain-containing protein [Candidatus Aminicenantes bacterium]
MRNIKYVFKMILLFSLISVPLAMQAHSFDGALISGRICSPDRCGIPGVSITLIEEASGQTTRLVTGLGGIYRAAGLPVGTYELRVEASGFDPEIVPDIDLTEGESRIIDITLSYSTIQEVVTVIGEAPRGALQATEARESAARDVGEALTRINGVSKVRKGGIANDIVLRGFASKDMNILIDGQKLYGACPNHMDPTAFHVDFSEVDRVEITKGPFDIRNQG